DGVVPDSGLAAGHGAGKFGDRLFVAAGYQLFREFDVGLLVIAIEGAGELVENGHGARIARAIRQRRRSLNTPLPFPLSRLRRPRGKALPTRGEGAQAANCVTT